MMSLNSQLGTTRVERKIARLVERDGATCVWCSRPVEIGGKTEQRATLDHIVPRSVCRSDHLDVLVLSCFKCNNARGSMSINEFCEVAERPNIHAINAANRRSRRFLRVRAGLYVGG